MKPTLSCVRKTATEIATIISNMVIYANHVMMVIMEPIVTLIVPLVVRNVLANKTVLSAIQAISDTHASLLAAAVQMIFV